jgi:hypothetical protein
MNELARLWNVDPLKVPHWAPKTHAMKIFHLAETGAIRFLWIIATNPCVSLPELHKIRRTLSQENLFTIVQDAFLTETARLADVILPAALWGEKTGTFTNMDRTVHISHKAVDPPGEARPDMDILLDFARRMDFRDLDGQPLVKWSTPEECFESWKQCSKGRPCDYSGLTYAMLSQRSGVRWPCNAEFPEGKEHLYAELRFPTGFHDCGDYGHDLETGGHIPPQKYQAHDPQGKAWLKAADYIPPEELPDDNYPFWFSTGRMVHHFHTRTKTGRTPELKAAAPEPFIQIHDDDAQRLNIADGDLMEVVSRRGTVRAPARIGGVLPGHLFMPFHFGYWDQPSGDGIGPDGRPTAANELTITAWDPISKQPTYKFAAVRASKASEKSLIQTAVDGAAHAGDKLKEIAVNILGTAHVHRSHVSDYIGMLQAANEEFAAACRQLADDHSENAEVVRGSEILRDMAHEATLRLQKFFDHYGVKKMAEPRKLRQTLFNHHRPGDFGLLREVHDLFLMACEVYVTAEILLDSAKELRDQELIDFCIWMKSQADRQQMWCTTQVKENAAQSLVVPQ